MVPPYEPRKVWPAWSSEPFRTTLIVTGNEHHLRALDRELANTGAVAVRTLEENVRIYHSDTRQPLPTTAPLRHHRHLSATLVRYAGLKRRVETFRGGRTTSVETWIDPGTAAAMLPPAGTNPPAIVVTDPTADSAVIPCTADALANHLTSAYQRTGQNNTLWLFAHPQPATTGRDELHALLSSGLHRCLPFLNGPPRLPSGPNLLPHVAVDLLTTGSTSYHPEYGQVCLTLTAWVNSAAHALNLRADADVPTIDDLLTLEGNPDTENSDVIRCVYAAQGGRRTDPETLTALAALAAHVPAHGLRCVADILAATVVGRPQPEAALAVLA